MADFFKGLAGGFQTGLQFGGAMRDKEERERLREAMQMTPQEMQQRQATPEELGRAQAETQRLAAQDAAMFGLSPQEQAQYAPHMPVEGQRIGATQYGLGGQTFNRMPTQQEIQQARYGAMADVIAERDPARAMEMRQRLEEQAYQAKRRPLELKGLEQSTALSGVQLTAAQRAERTAAGNEAAQSALAELRSNNTPITSQSLAQLAKTHGADYNALLSGELNQLGFNEKTAAVEMKNLSRDWSKAVLGGAPQVNKFLADKFDPDKTDNITPELVQTKAGYVVKYGDKILGEYGTHKDLSTLAAQVHGMINDDPLGTLRTLASVKASNAAAAYQEAHAGLIPAQARLLGAQADYYNKREPTGKDKVTAKIEEFKAAFKREPTEREMSQMFGLMAKDTGKPEPEMTKAQAKSWELLQKSDMWQQLEHKNDVAGMNKMLVNRGIDPALIGLPGDAGWVPKPTATPAAAPAAAAPVMQRGLYPGDEDWLNIPMRPLQQGTAVYTVPSPRGLLATPSYSAKPSSPNFRD